MNINKVERKNMKIVEYEARYNESNNKIYNYKNLIPMLNSYMIEDFDNFKLHYDKYINDAEMYCEFVSSSSNWKDDGLYYMKYDYCTCTTNWSYVLGSRIKKCYCKYGKQYYVYYWLKVCHKQSLKLSKEFIYKVGQYIRELGPINIHYNTLQHGLDLDYNVVLQNEYDDGDQCIKDKLQQQYKLLKVPKWSYNEKYSNMIHHGNSDLLYYGNVNKINIRNVFNLSNNIDEQYNDEDNSINSNQNDDEYVFSQTANDFYDELICSINEKINLTNNEYYHGVKVNIKNYTVQQIFHTIQNPKLLYEFYDYHPERNNDSTTHTHILHVWDFDSTQKVFIEEISESCPYHNTYKITITLCEPEEYKKEINESYFEDSEDDCA